MNDSAIAYARASEEELAGDAVALADQHDTVAAVIAARGLRTHACAFDRGIDSSAGLAERPALSLALRDLADGAASMLVVARLDRVSHSVRIWADLVWAANQGGWKIVIAEAPSERPGDSGEGAPSLGTAPKPQQRGIEVPGDSSESVAALFAAAAWEEHQWLSARTRAGLAAAQASGTRLGRPVEHKVEARQLVEKLRADGKSLRQIANELTASGIPTPRGGRWHSATIHRILQSADLDAQAVAKATTDVAAQGTEPAPTDAPSTADQAARAADFDQRFPGSYNLSEPPTP